MESKIAPTFAFIDPFGYSDTPMPVISRFMQHPSCEVFINFMIGSINRWASDPTKATALNRLFGTHDWKDIVEIEDTTERINAYADLYDTQLRTVANIKYVRRFLMINKFNQPVYFLFFGTNHKQGLRAMKNAMWSVDLSQGDRFSDRTDPKQMVLIKREADVLPLREKLIDIFKGSTVRIEDLQDFVLTETPYSPDKHLKKPVLVPLEDEGLIDISVPGKRRRHTYKDGSRIKFL